MAGSRTRAGARSVLAGADRASGERQVRRRRTTPLLAARENAGATQATETTETTPPAQRSEAAAPAKKAPARKASARKAPAKRPATKAPAAKKSAPPAAKAPAARKAAPPAEKAAQKPVAQKPVAQKPVAQKPVAQKPVAQKPVAQKVVPQKAVAPAKAAAKKPAAAKSPDPRPLRAAPAPATGPASSTGSSPGMRPAFRPAPANGEPEPTPRVAAAAAAAAPLPAGGTQSMAWMMVAQMGEALADVLSEAVADQVKSTELPEKVTDILGYVGRRLSGEYDLDDFGFDPEFTDMVWMGLMRPIYKRWFRVEVRGVENIPAEGGALIVANHSGTVPVDALMTAIAVHDEHPQHRFMRTLAADLVFQLPFVSGLARRTGSTLASNPDAEKLLSDGNVVGVWPEGFKGVGKPFSERYKLQRFGRGGFVSAALRTRAPIVPCSIVGAEEIYPIVGNVPSLARLLGLPYLPITPFFPWFGLLGAVPLPSKWLIEFGPPLRTDQYAAGAEDDPMLVFDLTDQVRQSIQQTLYSLLVQRRSIFF